jgi:demethylmenaquinone methyltransferase/2-methoxy-6-polyprenyl-1,4-benzoquinol methylase
MWDFLLRGFMDTMELRAGERALDVCAGTNAVGIALLKREPRLEVHAMDRSAEMQEVGRRRAEALGMRIHSVIGDVHKLPFPDNHFDVVTLQWATRHLRVKHVFGEIRRVLKPGGRFYHCDMLRPANPLVETLYYTYLRFCLNFTALVFGSGASAHGLKRYFINALEMFYSADELSVLLRELGFERVAARTVLAGMIGYHRAAKPA